MNSDQPVPTPDTGVAQPAAAQEGQVVASSQNQPSAPIAVGTNVAGPAAGESTALADSAAVYEQLVKSIISAQETIIGPIAVERAKQVEGIEIDKQSGLVHITGNPVQTLDKLIKQYSVLFGQISIEVCRDAASKYYSQINSDSLPEMLR